MHAVAFNHPLVEYTVKEIEAKVEEERGSGSGYKDCFNFKNDLKTGQVRSNNAQNRPRLTQEQTENAHRLRGPNVSAIDGRKVCLASQAI